MISYWYPDVTCPTGRPDYWWKQPNNAFYLIFTGTLELVVQHNEYQSSKADPKGHQLLWLFLLLIYSQWWRYDANFEFTKILGWLKQGNILCWTSKLDWQQRNKPLINPEFSNKMTTFSTTTITSKYFESLWHTNPSMTIMHNTSSRSDNAAAQE